MRAVQLSFVWALHWLLTGPGVLAAQQGILTGYVHNDSTGKPIVGAEVLLETQGRRTRTDDEGRYVLTSVPVGKRTLLVRLIGYLPRRLTITLAAGQTVHTDVGLSPSAVQLDPIEVTGHPAPQPHGIGLEAFEERRRRGFGRFVDSTILRRSEGQDLTTVLRRAGIEVTDRGEVLGRSRCAMTLYVDGIWIRPPTPRFTVAGLAAVEAYASVAQIPAEYDALNQTCGVLLLWTRK